MKKIYIVFTETKDGKYHSHAETIKAGENLMNFIKPNTTVAHVCETATAAGYLAAMWNRTYEKNNEYID